MTWRKRVGQFDDAFLVGAAVDEDPTFVQDLFDGHHLALTVGLAHADDREGLVQHDLVAAVDLARVEARVQGHAHLSPGGEDVDGAVLVEVDEGAVDRGRLRQFLDFVTQRRDLITRLLDRDGELLVVRATLGEGASGLEQFLLQHLDSSAGLLDVAHGRIARRTDHDLVVVLGNVVTAEGRGTVHNVTLGERGTPVKVTSLRSGPLELLDTSRHEGAPQ